MSKAPGRNERRIQSERSVEIAEAKARLAEAPIYEIAAQVPKRRVRKGGVQKGVNSPIRSGGHPPCEGCGGPVIRKDGESNHAFWVRRSCSFPCGQMARYKTLARLAAADGRPCAVCGTELQRRPGEVLSKWERRKSCSEECLSKLLSVTLKGRPQYREDTAIQLDDDLMSYGKGFGPDTDPGDGGTLRAVRPDDGLSLSVAGRYL